MALHLSESAERLKDKAIELTRKWKHFYLSTEHYFAAACHVDSACRAFLERKGLDLQGLEDEILDFVPEGDEVPIWEGIPETPRLRRVMGKNVQQEAENCRAMRVEPVHVVASILGDGKGIPVRILRERGYDIQDLHREILGGAAAAGRPVADRENRSQPAEVPAPAEKEPRKKKKQKTLDKYSHDLVARARDGKIDPVIGRNDEIRRVLQILTRKTKSNPVLIGEAGVGKTAVAWGLAQRIAEGTVPDALKHKRVLELSLSSMLAGAKHRGEFEERLDALVKEVLDDPDVVLFIDELHQLVGAGDSRGGMDAGNMLKPALARGDLAVLGATTTDEYRKFIEPDPALERRFQPVLVGEPSEEQALEILKGLRKRYEEHHGVKFSDEALLAAVKLSVRFLPDRNLPDKAIDLIDESAARVKTRSANFLLASNPIYDVSDEVIAEVVSDWTGIPVSRMTEEESARLLEMEDLLGQRVVGQDHAVTAVAQTIRVVRMGLVAPNRPGGVFLFLGPSGVGKTELAKALAEFLFGSESEMVRLDMSEFHDKHSIARLIGSPPGYVGHEEEGQLTKAVRTRPYCVVLLDEVEKAHPEVFDTFLQVFDDGRLTDSKGRTVNFTNCILVMTSNLGSRDVMASGGLNEGFAGQLDELPPLYQKALREHFRPEFINRIDEIVVFRALEKTDLVNIVEIHVGRLIKTVHEQRGIELDIDPSALDLILEHGYQPQFGARPLHRAIHTYLSRPLAEEMLRQRLDQGSRVMACREGDRLTFVPINRRTAAGRPATSADLDEELDEELDDED
ncbi:MAG: ATP-dependent Clp protease ATP-binding subunit [Armatimonadetes bacterium]|nr:ATP-dependent Clp protease ATP-binding subunit [Armatimonadota bacterium]